VYPAVCALVLVASACGSSADTGGSATTSSESISAAPTTEAESSSAGASSSAPVVGAEITIEDFEYRTPVSVRPGATVSVTNMDEAHSVTADDGSSFDITVTAGATVTFTAPTTPGSYAFHCIFHSNMNGVLVVE
jgi:plastocyanin